MGRQPRHRPQWPERTSTVVEPEVESCFLVGQIADGFEGQQRHAAIPARLGDGAALHVHQVAAQRLGQVLLARAISHYPARRGEAPDAVRELVVLERLLGLSPQLGVGAHLLAGVVTVLFSHDDVAQEQNLRRVRRAGDRRRFRR